MSSGIGCTVYTLDSTGNRIRLADGSPGDDPLAPTVLDALKVTWGRETTVDQPAASTCSFKMVDFSDAGGFADLVKVGTPLEVWAQSSGVEVVNRNRVINPGNYQRAGGWQAGANTYVGGPRRSTDSWPTQTSALDGCFGVYVLGQPGTTGTANISTTNDALFDVAGSEELAIQVHTKPDSTPRRARLALRTWDDAGAVIGTQYLPQVTQGTDWTQLAGILTTPANAAKGGLFVQVFDVAASYGEANDEFHYVDAGMVCPPGPDGTIPTYFDGDTVDPTGTYAYTWVGLPHQSASIQSIGGQASQIVPVFAGRCTSIKTAWDDSTDAPGASIDAIDFTADLENVIVGDEPWPVQRWTDRFRTIADLAGLTQYELDLFGNIQVSYRDVDAQGAMGLLGEIASSLDGILWPTVASGTSALWLEDPTNRPSFSELTFDDATGYVEIVPTDDPAADALTISACDVLRDPIEWVQDVQDVTTRVSVTWREQTVDEDGNPAPTDRTTTVINPDREKAFGNRAVSLSSQLISGAEASNVADKILSRTGGTNWRITGLSMYDDGDPAAEPDEFAEILITLLDAGTRHGATIQLTDLPDWSPAASPGIYVEGGDCTFTGGAWALDLTVSNPAGLGGSVNWQELRESSGGAWTWAMFDPAISWVDLNGVAAPT